MRKLLCIFWIHSWLKPKQYNGKIQKKCKYCSKLSDKIPKQKVKPIKPIEYLRQQADILKEIHEELKLMNRFFDGIARELEAKKLEQQRIREAEQKAREELLARSEIDRMQQGFDETING